MTPIEQLLAKLPTAKKAGSGWSARCPAHEDRRASLSVSEGDDGTALVKCHAGCETSAILAAFAVKAETTGPTTNDVDGFRPFPVDSLPEPIRSFTAAVAKAIGCDPSYVALPLLVALASAIGNTRRLRLKPGWTVPAILWGAVVGESGSAKTPAFKLVMKPVRDRQQRALKRYEEATKEYENDLARWEKERTAWEKNKTEKGDPPQKPEAPQADRCIVQDTTVEALSPILKCNPRGLLLARDELAGWIGSFDRYAGKAKAGADSANWLSMFNADTIIVDRRTGNPPTIYVPHAAVCIIGGIQPGILRRILSSEHLDSGLAARVLLTFPPRKAKRWTETGIDQRTEDELAGLFDHLYELKPSEDENGDLRPGLLILGPEAKQIWVAYYDEHNREQADLTGELAAAWSKLEEYAARVALVVHFTRWAANDPALENGIVDAVSMRAGITLAKWFKGEAVRVYAMLSETDTERDGRRLVEWIGRKGGMVTAREAQQGCRSLKEPGAAEAALEALVKSGRGCWVPTLAGQRGQPTRRFRLSTVSTSTVFEKPTGKTNTVDVDTVDAAKTTATPTDGRLFPEERGLPD